MPKKEAPFLRFMRSYEICRDTGCWIWNSSKYKNGYGWIKAFGKVVSAHRFAYELYNGKIKSGMQILHQCDRRDCVNPDHMRVGTHKENMREAAERGRMRSGKDHHMYGKKNPRPNQAHRVRVLGKVYGSKKEAERCLGLGGGTVNYWIKNKPEKAQLCKEKK